MKTTRNVTYFLTVVAFILIAMAVMASLSRIPEYSKEEIQSFKEELSKAREKYATAIRLHGLSSPEARLLEAQCHRLEDLEAELNNRDSIVQTFRSLRTPLLIVAIMLIGVALVKSLPTKWAKEKLFQ